MALLCADVFFVVFSAGKSLQAPQVPGVAPTSKSGCAQSCFRSVSASFGKLTLQPTPQRWWRLPYHVEGLLCENPGRSRGGGVYSHFELG